MAKFIFISVLSLMIFTTPVSVDKPEDGKVTVDFRWLEPQIIDKVTTEKGRPISCGGKDYYMHLKPVLTSEDISDANLSELFIVDRVQYAVSFRLKKESIEKLVQACGDRSGRQLTVCVNGRWYGSTYFDRDKARSEGFSAPIAGFIRSKSLAEQILQVGRKSVKRTEE